MMTTDELRAICAEHGITVSLTGLMREAAAARLLDVAPRTLRQWRMDGVGPRAVRLGGAWRYSLDSIAHALTPPAEAGGIQQKPAESDLDECIEHTDDAASPKKAVAS